MNQNRQPAGVPIGGQFDSNSHDEAAAFGSVPDDDSHLNVEELNEGDTIDLTRNVIDLIESGEATDFDREMIGRHEITEMVYDEDLGGVRIGLRNSVHRDRFWLVAEGDNTQTFDRVHPVEVADVIDAEDLAPSDLIDMTRTVDEYLADLDRGGGDDLSGIKDAIKMRGLYRVVSVDDEGGGDHNVVLRSESDPFADDISWMAMKDVTTFDYVSDRAEGISRDLLDPNGGKEAIFRDLPSGYRNDVRTAVRAAIVNDTGESAGVIAGRMVDPAGGESAILRDFPDSRKSDARRAIIAAVKAARKD